MNKMINQFFTFSITCVSLQARLPYPIQFSIPEIKIVKEIPKKTRDFAHIIPGQLNTYIYTDEKDYYAGYQNSYFAITCKKGGWDCMRHYEILANGCIPYFLNLDNCDPNIMYFLPRELIKEAMNLEGVSYLHIDHAKFNKKRYYEILEKLLDHTRKYLTTRAMAEYLLKTINYTGTGNILLLSQDPNPDYLRCLSLIGLKEIYGNKVVDFPKIEHVYTSYNKNIKELYGKGMSYSRIVPDEQVDRENIEQRIKNKEFDLIIYGSVHRGILFYDLVTNTYSQDQIVYLCGEDEHVCSFINFNNLFLREFNPHLYN